MKREKIEEKINAYGKDVKYVKSYMNLFVWIMVVLFVYSAIDLTFHAKDHSLFDVVRMQLLAGFSVFCAFVIRDLDKFGLRSNIILLVAWPVSYAVSLFFYLRDASTAMGEVAAGLSDLGPIGGMFAGGIVAGTQIGIILALVRLLIIAAICGGYIWALLKDQELFNKTVKELQQ